MKKGLLFVVIAIIALVFGFVIFRQEGSSPASSTQVSPEDADVVVSMTREGFFPEEITINKRDTVVWVNNGDGYLWPASDIHPTHLIYPEFDPREPLGVGESWTFRFEEAGIWKYHDHLWPTSVGVVEVYETRR